MCGLAGYLTSLFCDEPAVVLQRMARTIVHRGPDGGGHWLDKDCGVGLAHRRLSILDLSAAGHQPMISVGGRYVVVFNGEIYNHMEIRNDLEKLRGENSWRGHSDTETLLGGFESWGIRDTVERAVGMFALAVWDRDMQSLTLCRDRLGEKPMYYGWQGNTFLFGSELKALRAHPAFRSEIDRGALTLMLRHKCVPGPYSIYQGISKLPAGSLLEVSLKNPQPNIRPYWSGIRTVEDGLANAMMFGPRPIVDELEALLKNAVRQQMVADVPLGAFLSGGIDSSTIVALMQSQSGRPVKTFSIGFVEHGYNEADFAKSVAAHLGTEHTELYVTPRDAMEVIPRLPALYDEPFADESQIPTFLLAQLARQQVKVALSGDGGDEIFGGYNRYAVASTEWKRIVRIPVSLRRMLGVVILSITPRAWDGLIKTASGLLPSNFDRGNIGDRLHKAAGVLGCRSIDELYLSLVSHWNDPGAVVINGFEPETVITNSNSHPRTDDPVERMMALDMLSFLTDDILVKVDRAAMGASLETRVPFLNHRVVEFAWRIPLQYKLREGTTKWALRQVLYRYVPQQLVERPKMGFRLPIADWLRGPLRDWTEDLLDESKLRQDGFFRPHHIRKKWRDHLSGRRNWQQHLWDVLMFQAWLAMTRTDH